MPRYMIEGLLHILSPWFILTGLFIIVHIFEISITKLIGEPAAWLIFIMGICVGFFYSAYMSFELANEADRRNKLVKEAEEKMRSGDGGTLC